MRPTPCRSDELPYGLRSKPILHLSRPLKYRLRIASFAPHCIAPFLSHHSCSEILTRRYFKFHCIAQKTVAREILAAARFKFTLDAASWLVSFNLSPHFILSLNFKICSNFRSLQALKAPLKFLRSHLAYARPDFAQTPLLRPRRGILR